MLSPHLEAEEPNPFQGFGAGETFGFVYHKCGEEGLRELLSVVDSLTCEFLGDAAAELEKAGLSKPAAIVLEIAATKPSGLDVDNPYTDEEGSQNWLAWRKNWINRRQVETGELEERLRRENRRKMRKAKHS